MIYGLTDGEARWPRIGSLRKGDEKPETGNKPGKDLDKEFRFVGNDPETDLDFERVFGSTHVDGLTVRLPYPGVPQVWQAWREHWVAGGLVCRCDGINHVFWRDAKGEYQTDPKPCPGRATCLAKPVGRLEVLIPALERMGTVSVLTTSVNDIVNLDACLRQLALTFGDLTNVPLRLSRVSRAISTPAADGKRARRIKWLIHLEAEPEWVRHMLTARGQAPLELTAREVRALPPPPDDGADDDTGGGYSPTTDLDVFDPRSGGDAGGGERPDAPDHWTPEIAACKRVQDVEALLPRIAEIEPLPRRENTLRLAYARIVDLVSPVLDRLDWSNPRIAERTLGNAVLKLDPLPADTPGLNLALDKVEAARQRLEGLRRAPATDQPRRQMAMAAVREGAVS